MTSFVRYVHGAGAYGSRDFDSRLPAPPPRTQTITEVAARVSAFEGVGICTEFDTFEGRQYDQETGRKLFAGPPRCEPAVRVQLCAGRMRDGLGNLWG